MPNYGSHLTPREIDLIRELLRDAPGLKEIAFRLGVTEGTAKVYVSKLCAKLDIHGLVQLALWAERSGRFSNGAMARPRVCGRIPWPCRFGCVENPARLDSIDFHHIECPTCGARGPNRQTHAGAVAAWDEMMKGSELRSSPLPSDPNENSGT